MREDERWREWGYFSWDLAGLMGRGLGGRFVSFVFCCLLVILKSIGESSCTSFLIS
jgi:hypothetical protein